MTRTYSLPAILAIAIPLGVVALCAILSLTLIIIRQSVISHREKRAYASARNDVFRRRSAASSNSPNSHKKERPSRYGFCNFLCCIPDTDELVPSSTQIPEHASRNLNRDGTTTKSNNYRSREGQSNDEMRQHCTSAAGGQANTSQKSSRTNNTKIESQIQDTRQELVRQNSAALLDVENRELQLKRLDIGAASPSNASVPHDLGSPKPPEAAMSRGNLEEDVEQTDVLLNLYFARREGSANNALNTPSVLSFPADPSFTGALASDISWQAQLLTESPSRSLQQSDRSLEGLRHETKDATFRSALDTPVPKAMLGSAKEESSKIQSVPQKQQFPDLQSPINIPFDWSQGKDYVADLVPPAKKVTQGLSSPRVSPVSSKVVLYSRSPRHLSENSDVSITTPKYPQQDMESVKSAYETPPIAPLVPTDKASSSGSSGRPKLDEQNIHHNPEDNGRMLGVSVSRSLTRSIEDKPISTSVTEEVNKGVSFDNRPPNNGADQSNTVVMASGASAVDLDDNQRILQLLRRDESLHKGNAHFHREQVDQRRPAVSSFTGSLVRGSFNAGSDRNTTGYLPLEEYPEEHEKAMTSRSTNYSGSQSNNSLSSQKASHLDSGNWPDSLVSLAPTALDKLIDHSDLGMTVPLIEGSDESKKSQKERHRKVRRSIKDTRMESPLTASTGSLRPSSRSSSLTASTTWLTPSRASRSSAEHQTAISETAAVVRPLAVKTSSSIRNIALLNVPQAPRSPGYSPGQVGAQAPSPEQDSAKLGKIFRRLSTFAYGGGGKGGGGSNLLGMPDPSRQHHEHHHDKQEARRRSDETRENRKPARVRISKSTRMNKPLPIMPSAIEDGLIANLNGAKHLVIQNYTKKLNDEIDLAVGETVRVYQLFDDGWCLARTTSHTSQTGICPHVCLKRLG